MRVRLPVVVAALIVVLAAAWWATKSQQRSPEIATRPASGTSADPERTFASTPFPHSSPTAPPSQRADDGFSDENVNAIRAQPLKRAELFEPDADSTDAASWKVRWHRSCEALRPGKRFADLREALRSEGFDTQSDYPTQGMVLDWNRYFRSPQGVYLQLSANWRGGTPPQYQVAMYMADNPDFSGAVLPKESRLIPQKELPWKETTAVLDAVAADLLAQGYRPGKRSTVLSSRPEHDPDAPEEARVEAWGAFPRVFQFDTTFCVPSRGYLCYCDPNAPWQEEEEGR